MPKTEIFILTLMMLAFTTRHMVRSAHLVQFDFAISDRYSHKKIHTALLGTGCGGRSSPPQRCHMHIIPVYT